MRHLGIQSVLLSLALGLAGCTAMRLPLTGVGSPERGTATVILTPRLTESRHVQAVVPLYTQASINRLDILPYAEQTPGVYWPLLASTGIASDTTDPSLMLRVSMASPSIDLTKTVSLTNLRPNQRYRVFARAYDAADALISEDASSSVDVAVGSDDRPTMGTLPVKLEDRVFAAATTVTLLHFGSRTYDRVETQVVTVSGATELPLATGTATYSAGFHGKQLQLTGLRSGVTYRVKATALNASDTVLATASVDVPITNDDAPAAKELELYVPYPESTAAGQENQSGTDDGTGTAAKFYFPWGMAQDATGTLYIVDSYNHRIRKMTSDSTVTTLVTGLAYPKEVVVDATGTVFVANTDGRSIVKVTSAGAKSNLATSLGYPRGIAIAANGDLYVADTENHQVCKLTQSGTKTTLAGLSGTSGSDDGNGTGARFNRPQGLVVDSKGNVFVCDYDNHTIRKITPAGVVTTFAGKAGTSGATDGNGADARFRQPTSIAVDRNDNLYVTELVANRVRVISPTGKVRTLTTSTPLRAPSGVLIDPSGVIYVAEGTANVIRKLQ